MRSCFGTTCAGFFLLVTVMEPFSRVLVPIVPPTPAEPQAMGLLLCRDLIFTSKVKGTATDLGYPMMVAQAESEARSVIEIYQPQVVFVDLTAGAMAAPSALIGYLKLAHSNVCFIAFGPHVEVDALASARAAGCHVVMPRSKFAAELPELMRQYFTHPAVRNS
jgi:hypothetical protein